MIWKELWNIKRVPHNMFQKPSKEQTIFCFIVDYSANLEKYARASSSSSSTALVTVGSVGDLERA